MIELDSKPYQRLRDFGANPNQHDLSSQELGRLDDLDEAMGDLPIHDWDADKS